MRLRLYFCLLDRGQIYGMLSPRLRQILAEPLNLTPGPTGEVTPHTPNALVVGPGLKFASRELALATSVVYQLYGTTTPFRVSYYHGS